MSTNDSENSEKLLNLARRFDDQLRNGPNVIGPVTVLGIGNSSQMPDKELSPEELEELKQAKAALYFLNRVRTDFDTANQSDSVQLIPQHESTVRGFDTKNDHVPVGPQPEFETLGRFKIIETIGEGGFAKVFRALDPKLDREVALKVPKPQTLASDEARSRFQREARSTALLSHPAIVPLFETGNVGPITYIASEYCPGTDLSRWFNSELNRSVDARTAALIVARLADAVQHAHQRGIVHRDLKPANVLVIDGEGTVAERVRVTDFGMARQISEGESSVTIDGAVVGTPAYMAPEQARGSQNVNGSADIFSLGIMLYELLTGKLPFKKDNHVATLISIEQDTPIPPRTLNGTVPRDLQAICLKCLEKSPDRRYADAFSLGEDLRLWLDGRATTARPMTSFEKLGRWIRREPKLASTTAFAFTSLLIGLAVAMWQGNVASNHLAVSEAQKDRAFRNVNLLGTTVENILHQYGELVQKDEVLTDIHRDILEQMISVHKTVVDEEAEEVEISSRTIDAYTDIARIYRNLAEYEKAQEICDQGKDLYKLLEKNAPQKAKPILPAYAMLLGQEVIICLDIGDRERAIELLQTCLQLTSDKPDSQDELEYIYSRFYFYRHLGLAFNGIGKRDENFEAANKGFELSQKLFQLEPENEQYIEAFARSHQDVASAASTLGKHELSADLLAKALELISGLHEDEQSENDYRYRLAFLNGELSFAHRNLKNYELAEELSIEAVESLQDLAIEMPTIAYVHDRLGHMSLRHFDLLRSMKRYDDLEQFYPIAREAVDNVRKPRTGPIWMVVLRRRFANHLTKHKRNETETVVKVLEEGIAICKKAIENYSTHASLHYELADMYRIRGIAETRRTGELTHTSKYADASALSSIEAYKLKPESSRYRRAARTRTAYHAHLLGLINRHDEAAASIERFSNAFLEDGEVQMDVAVLYSRLIETCSEANQSVDWIAELQMKAVGCLRQAKSLDLEIESKLGALKKKGVTPEFHEIIKLSGL